MKPLLVTGAICILLVGAIASACLASSPDSVISVTVLESAALTVRLHIKQPANMADTNWLTMEFENPGPHGLGIKSVRCRMSQTLYNDQTGRPISSGGLFSGNLFDFFPENWDTPRALPVTLAMGTRRIHQPTSDRGSSLLRIPVRDSVLVRATIHMSVETSYRGDSSTPELNGLPFEFYWHAPDSADFVEMRKQLRDMMKHPRRWQHAAMEATLLLTPGVYESLTVHELLDGLDRRRNSPSRGNLTRHINDHHSGDSLVTAHVLQRLQERDREMVGNLLHRGRNIWNSRFIEPLLDLYETKERGDVVILELLWNHREDWPPELNIPQLLTGRARVWIQTPSKPIEQWSDKEFRAVSRYITPLGYTCDTTVIDSLLPFLDHRIRTTDLRMHATYGLRSPAPPSRVCDHALEAILRILGKEPYDAYARAITSLDLPQPVTSDSLSQVLRDTMIDQLRTRLTTDRH